MWTLLVLGSVEVFLAVAADICHNNQMGFYDEIGCEPLLIGLDGCPVSFDCSMITNRLPNKCYYKGKAYDEGHFLDQKDNPCLRQCSCNSYYGTGLSFVCIRSDCARVFQGPPSPGCRWKYESGQCCSTLVCGEQSTTTTTAKPDVCEYGSKKYQAGEQFQITDGSCLTCTCQPGFNGSLVEPFCRKKKCDLELLYGQYIAKGCVPVYYGKNSCCPSGWRCPRKSDRVERKNPNIPVSGFQCQFGNITMQLGDQLNVENPSLDVECVCRIPPYPTCIEKNE